MVSWASTAGANEANEASSKVKPACAANTPELVGVNGWAGDTAEEPDVAGENWDSGSKKKLKSWGTAE